MYSAISPFMVHAGLDRTRERSMVRDILSPLPTSRARKANIRSRRIMMTDGRGKNCFFSFGQGSCDIDNKFTITCPKIMLNSRPVNMSCSPRELQMSRSFTSSAYLRSHL